MMTMRKKLMTAALASSIALVPAARAMANGGDFIAGALIGGVAGAAINNSVRNHREAQARAYHREAVTRSSSTSYSSSYSAARSENARVQSALNYFGFDAGSPDGVVGRNTQDAIAQYQQALGYPQTGTLAPYEETFLMNSYDRAQSGGASTEQLMATTPGGGPAVLQKWQHEAAQNIDPNQPPSRSQPTTAQMN